MLNKNSKKESKLVPLNSSSISLILATSAVWVGLIAGGIYVKEYTGISIPSLNINNQKVQVLKISKDVKNGSIIKSSDLKIVKESATDIVANASNNPKEVIGKTALKNFYPNEQILLSDITVKNSEELKPCSIPVTLGNLSDNTINSGDYVDVVLNYKSQVQKADKKPDIVSSKMLVKSVTDSKGLSIQNYNSKASTDVQIPAYITVMGTEKDILFIEDAKKKGSLDFYLYPNKNSKASTRTYIPSWEYPQQSTVK